MKNGTTQVLACPIVVKDYNAHMGAVDKSDMLKHCYEINRRSKKWWLRIFWHFLEVTMVNVYILFTQKANCKTISLKHFRQTIAISLVGVNSHKSTMGRSRSNNPQVNHFRRIVPYEVRYEKAAHLLVYGTFRRCSYCSSANELHRTNWMCTVCQVGLCLNSQTNRFLLFPSKDNE
ncbi:hypothetical protein NQ314_005986 [Rhamnusium bicolor]|uniref:PiggyBac transposable element-derived protein domain-containing protein n=1 Tax=Rhamnusium bicolor TaxID=1586634 RepID=A0AAV8ZBU1_9CUCU|nr:hypothetical protein NQ314_005986 [Rhamnusium bicolor]